MFCIVQERRRRTDQVNYWLKKWCCDRGFGYYDLGQAFERPGVWASDGVRLTRWGKSGEQVGWIDYQCFKLAGDGTHRYREGPANAAILVNYGEKPLSCPVGSCDVSSEKITLPIAFLHPSRDTCTFGFPKVPVWEISRKN